MEARQRFRPFTGDTERRIRLARPPIALALCQVRWPELTQLQGGLDAVAVDVGRALGDYPLHEQAQQAAISITPDGVKQVPSEVIHQWHSADRTWHVVLSSRAIAVFCTSYMGFNDFNRRFGCVVDVVCGVIEIPVIERVGLRHVNRLDDAAMLTKLDDTLEPAVLGFGALKPKSPNAVRLTSMNQAVYAVGNDRLQARAGYVNAGDSPDPAIQALDGESWVLDLDSFYEGNVVFGRNELQEAVSRLADINYDFFKLVASEKYIGLIEES